MDINEQLQVAFLGIENRSNAVIQNAGELKAIADKLRQMPPPPEPLQPKVFEYIDSLEQAANNAIQSGNEAKEIKKEIETLLNQNG